MKAELDLSSAVTLYVVQIDTLVLHFIKKMIHNNILPTKNVTDQYSNDVNELQILGNTRILCYKYLRLKSCNNTEKLQHMEWSK